MGVGARPNAFLCVSLLLRVARCSVVQCLSAAVLLSQAVTGGAMASIPPMYGRSTSGMTTLPSACW